MSKKQFTLRFKSYDNFKNPTFIMTNKEAEAETYDKLVQDLEKMQAKWTDIENFAIYHSESNEYVIFRTCPSDKFSWRKGNYYTITYKYKIKTSKTGTKYLNALVSGSRIFKRVTEDSGDEVELSD